ncbi:MAG: ankyrin repeat domain-containing protein [Burkholderiales bacterium]|nr:ankyrin repeat domain-containing protein [Burkholderiales bacterium]
MNQAVFSRRVLLALSLALAAPLVRAQDADPFFRAIKQDNDLALRNLLARGVDPNTRDEKGMPGLYVALQEGTLKAANVLLASPRLQPESRNPADESPLMMAALKGHLDIAARLIKLGADVNKPGWTPLHYAATHGHLKIMELLLEEHAFIDAESPNGTTPLMMAASYGTPEAVKLLIEAGADIHMRNQKGMAALDFARRAERPDSVELIDTALRWARQKQGPRGKW